MTVKLQQKLQPILQEYTNHLKNEGFTQQEIENYLLNNNLLENLVDGETFDSLRAIKNTYGIKLSTVTAIKTIADYIKFSKHLNVRKTEQKLQDKEFLRECNKSNLDINSIIYFLAKGFSEERAKDFVKDYKTGDFKYDHFVGIYFNGKIFKKYEDLWLYAEVRNPNQFRYRFLDLKMNINDSIFADFDEYDEDEEIPIEYKSKPLFYNGEKFENLYDLSKFVGISTYKLRRMHNKAGKPEDFYEIITDYFKELDETTVIYNGKRYDNPTELCRDMGASLAYFKSYMADNNATKLEAMKQLVKYGSDSIKPFKVQGKYFGRISEVARHFDIKAADISMRMNRNGLKIDEAVSQLLKKKALEKKGYDASKARTLAYRELKVIRHISTQDSETYQTYDELADKLNCDLKQAYKVRKSLVKENESVEDIDIALVLMYMHYNVYVYSKEKARTFLFEGKIYNSMEELCNKIGYNYKEIKELSDTMPEHYEYTRLIKAFNQLHGKSFDAVKIHCK